MQLFQFSPERTWKIVVNAHSSVSKCERGTSASSYPGVPGRTRNPFSSNRSRLAKNCIPIME